jgi:hypothetical protein
MRGLLTKFNIDFTPLRGMITSQAFGSSLLQTINEELITDDSIVKDIVTSKYQPEILAVYTLVFGAAMYLQYYFLLRRSSWENIDQYRRDRRIFSCIMTIFFLLFVRNVENAI